MIYLSDVAHEAGVSTATASRALNHHPAISDATRQRVEAAAQKLGYRRRKSHRAKKNPDKTLGVIVPDLIAHQHACMLDALVQQFRRMKYSLAVMSVKGDPNEAVHAAKQLCAMGINMLLIQGDGKMASKALIAAANARDVPVMLISSGHLSWADCDCICLDEQREAGMAIEHLRARGYRRIAFIGDLSSAGRRVAFLHAMHGMKMKIDPDFVRIGAEGLERGGYLRMKEMLEMCRRPDAVCCGCGQMAVGAIQAIHEAGLRIVSDIAVLSMNDFDMLEYISGGISAVSVPYAEIAAAAMQTLLKRRELSAGGARQFEVKPALKVRSTT